MLSKRRSVAFQLLIPFEVGLVVFFLVFEDVAEHYANAVYSRIQTATNSSREQLLTFPAAELLSEDDRLLLLIISMLCFLCNTRVLN